MQNYYTEATSNLERYLKTYPNDKNLPYAHYLEAMCYYESIIDETFSLLEKFPSDLYVEVIRALSIPLLSFLIFIEK